MRVLAFLQEILKNLELHRQTFSQIHKDRSVNGVPVPPEQLHDMAERYDLYEICDNDASYWMSFMELDVNNNPETFIFLK